MVCSWADTDRRACRVSAHETRFRSWPQYALHTFRAIRCEKYRPHQAAERSNERDLLLAAIQKLPPERQELLTLKFVERMSNAKIGQVLGRSEGAIKSLYHRTLVSLKEHLTEHENLVKVFEINDEIND